MSICRKLVTSSVGEVVGCGGACRLKEQRLGVWRAGIPRSKSRLGLGTVPWRMGRAGWAAFRLVDDMVTVIVITITVTDMHSTITKHVLGSLC